MTTKKSEPCIILDQETIIAQCTPRASGALALLRLSGPRAISIASELSKLPGNKNLADQTTHTIHYGYVVDEQGAHIDQVLFFLMRAPKTFTGEDVVEISSHNNPFIISNIIERAIQCGARIAQEGEFSRRAFLHGKLDLAQAEALNELIHAQTHMGLKASLAQLEGSLSHKIVDLEDDLLHALAFSEASFEFIEEEGAEFAQQITELLTRIGQKITTLKKNFDQRKHVREGIRIALIGSVNTGKSSLFNKLIEQERAIVTNIPGTTRDVIEAGVYNEQTYQTLVDTAGLRNTNDSIEQEGIRRSQIEAHKADVILLVYDAARTMNDAEQKIYTELLCEHANKIIIVRNKIDLATSLPPAFDGYVTIDISCASEHNIDLLRNTVAQKIKNLFAGEASPYLLNERHYNVLLEAEKSLQCIPPLLSDQPAYELISVHIKDALTHLSLFSGKTVTEQGLDLIFKKFCVGK